MTSKINSALHSNSGLSGLTGECFVYKNSAACLLFGAATAYAASLVVTSLISGNGLYSKTNAIESLKWASVTVAALLAIGFTSALAGSIRRDKNPKENFTDAVKGGVAAVGAVSAVKLLNEAVVEPFCQAKTASFMF